MNSSFVTPPLIGLGSLLALFPLSAQAYIDPGTGSLLLQGLIGALAGFMVAASLYWSKIKRFFHKVLGHPTADLDDPPPQSAGVVSANPADDPGGHSPVQVPKSHVEGDKHQP